MQSIVDMRSQLDTLQQQLGTGMKSDTYSGLGLARGLTVGLRSQLSANAGFQDTNTSVGVRLDLAQTALGQISSIGQSAQSTIMQSPFAINGGNQTTDQKTALSQLDQVIGLLNTQAGGRYLFSGSAVDQPAVASTDEIMNGSGGKAGFTQVVSERKQADLGADGLGRLVIGSPSSTAVSVSDDVPGSPFGMKFAGVNSTLSGATVVSSATGVSVDLGAGGVQNGQTLKLSFTLPDGSNADLTLTATTASPPGPNQFTIDPDPTVTASNLTAAITSGVSTLAGTALTAASAVAAGNDFFNTDATHPPQRVDGPPFDTATALVDGTPSNTVTWYTGEAGSTSARSTSTARIDQSITVNYGMRANEQALRLAVQNIATFAATTYSTTDANAAGSYTALKQRLTQSLDGPPGQQQISDIASELAGAQTTLQNTKDRLDQSTATMTDVLQNAETVPQEQVAAQILTLQTSLQATLQTTAMLLKTSLVNYLPVS
ncbi:MAG: hypothetical protein ACRDT5_16390 [Mycobacterium sp.]